jgi:hypothetical protein
MNGAGWRSSPLSKPTHLLILSLVILTAMGGAAWRLLISRGGASSAPVAAVAEPPPATTPAPIPERPAPLASAPGPVATLEELARPWAAKKFDFVRPDTHATVPAMVIRLPGVAGNHSNAYWAFALPAPFGWCNLDYVTDLKELAVRYGYSATHPMLVAPCNGSLYDPLRMGVVGNGIWVRGELAQGPGIRPPTAIRIRLDGRSIIADRIE